MKIETLFCIYIRNSENRGSALCAFTLEEEAEVQKIRLLEHNPELSPQDIRIGSIQY